MSFPYTPHPSSSSMDLDIPAYPKWRFQTSDARSEAPPSQRPSPKSSPPVPPKCQPQPAMPLPREIRIGEWDIDGDLIFTTSYPPVQEYLDTLRVAGECVPAPSELIFALASLHVFLKTQDRAHWILWKQANYWQHAKVVDKIALHQPRLIKCRVAWIGAHEMKRTLNAIQEKFLYTVIREEWYPTDYQPSETQRRTTRSSGDSSEMSIDEYFNLGKRKQSIGRKVCKIVKKTQPKSPVIKKHRARPSSSPLKSTHPREIPQLDDLPPTEPSAAEPLPSLFPATHLRSTSQSSTETLVEPRRSTSVVSSLGKSASSNPKKRKVNDAEEKEIDSVAPPQEPETKGMVTRGRASKIRHIVEMEQTSLTLSNPSTLVNDSRAKATRSRPAAKKARIS